MLEIDLEIDRYLAAGDWLKAAAALRHRGELLRAQEVYERAWDFENAAAVAKERGDALAQLRIALRQQDTQTAQTLGQALRSAPAAEQERAAALYEQHHLYLDAATLYEGLEHLERASELYRRSGPIGALHAARIAEKQGRLVEAAHGYAAALQTEQGTPFERSSAALGHGRVLMRCGNLDEAVRSLQDARRLAHRHLHEELPQTPFSALADEIEAQLIDCLVALGEIEVARPVLSSYRARRKVNTGTQILDDALVEPAEFVQRRAERVDLGSEPRLLGRYRLEALLGAGSMGRVYLASDEWQSQKVAVKLLPLAASASPAHAGLYRRFCREAEVLCRLRHPNLVELFEFHATAGVLVMEYLPNGALSSAALPLPLPLLRRMLVEIVDALLLVHSAGVLHRDIKPDNLFLSPTGAAKLADFGAATLRDIGLTQTEGLIGTLAYMAPEQIQGDGLSFATDVYGLAATAFELGTGRRPFRGPDFIEQHLSAPPPDARSVRPELPEPWARLLQRLLHKSAPARCTDLEALRADLLALPTPALGDVETRSAAAPVAKASPTGIPAEPSLLFKTAQSALYLTTDARLGRPLLVERFNPGAMQSELGVAHLGWLRAMAKLAGPGLQHLLRIDLHSPQGAQIFFEAPHGLPVTPHAPLNAAERAQLERVLLRLHTAGQAHGSVATAIMREPAHPLLLLSGHGPLSRGGLPEAGSDLADLERLCGDKPRGAAG